MFHTPQSDATPLASAFFLSTPADLKRKNDPLDSRFLRVIGFSDPVGGSNSPMPVPTGMDS
jgi:hypothetical protein